MKTIGEAALQKIAALVKSSLANKADTNHRHKQSDITDFPSALPANGGNSNTVSGYKVVVSSSAPTNADNNTITFVTG